MEKELKKIEAIEKTFSYTTFDFLFPWHMNLGKYEQNNGENDFAYTPFKTFNRRRNFLVWLHSDKFKYLFSEEELKRRDEAESLLFKTSIGMKSLGIFLLLNLRLFRRPIGRPITFDIFLMYFGSYCILGSNIPGIFYGWPLYSDLVKKLLESEKLRKRGLRNTSEFLNKTALSDAKCIYYMYDIEFAKYY